MNFFFCYKSKLLFVTAKADIYILLSFTKGKHKAGCVIPLKFTFHCRLMQSSVANYWSNGSLQDKIIYLLIDKTNTSNMKCNATNIERRNKLIQKISLILTWSVESMVSQSAVFPRLTQEVCYQ